MHGNLQFKCIYLAVCKPAHTTIIQLYFNQDLKINSIHKYIGQCLDGRKKCKKKKIYICFFKISKNHLETVIICSFAFNNQNFGQAKENLAVTCGPASPAF